MKVGELVQRLCQFPKDLEVVYYDEQGVIAVDYVEEDIVKKDFITVTTDSDNKTLKKDEKYIRLT